MTGKRVLLADDLTPVLQTTAKLLEGSFEVVGMVSDGQAALDAVLALAPDLAVLDISMPGMSGIEVARELKRRSSSTKIVYLTVHEDTDILATCLAAAGLTEGGKSLVEAKNRTR